jgi:uncharacterized protein (UPF0335 family)
MRTCTDCTSARENPHWYRFCPSCIWCGARLIQRIKALQRPREELTQRMKTVLADWTAYGHDETELRRLVAGPTPLQPLDHADESEASPKKGKRR